MDPTQDTRQGGGLVMTKAGHACRPCHGPALFSEGWRLHGWAPSRFRNGLAHLMPGHSGVFPKRWAPGWRTERETRVPRTQRPPHREAVGRVLRLRGAAGEGGEAQSSFKGRGRAGEHLKSHGQAAGKQGAGSVWWPVPGWGSAWRWSHRWPCPWHPPPPCPP